MSAAVELNNIAKTYVRGQQRVAVLGDVDFTIEAGEFVALMGPSGSGKTTLLNLIAGLDSPTSGELIIGGKRIDQLSDKELARWRSRNIGFVFQFYNLLPELSAERNVEVPLLLSNLSKARRKANVAAALELVGLSHRCQHMPSELSGGQQQRVSIARAIVADPTILVCDEPTGDLDRESAEAVLTLLQILNRQLGKTIVMVTHDPKAAEYASRQLHVDKGKLVAVPTHVVTEVRSAPKVASAEYVVVRPRSGKSHAPLPSEPPPDKKPRADSVATLPVPSPRVTTVVQNHRNPLHIYIAGAAALVTVLACTWYLANRIDAGIRPSAAAQVRARVAENTATQNVRRESPRPQIAVKLQQAQRAVSEGRFIDPPDDNALDLYRQVLSIDADNFAARAGLHDIADKILQRAERALLAGQPEAAAAALQSVRHIQPDHPHLAFVAAQLAHQQTSGTTLLERTKDVAAAPSPAVREAAARAQPEAMPQSISTSTPTRIPTPAPAPTPTPTLTPVPVPTIALQVPVVASPPPDDARTPDQDKDRAQMPNAPSAKESNAPISLKRILSVEPLYPEAARQKNLSGWVKLRFTVTATGDTTDVEVLDSSLESVFDAAAVNAVKRWRYDPPLRDGQPVSTRTAVRIKFVSPR